ncbi:MAG TPA: OsmC family protein [Vicinamibacterales bacterium]|nr:OsmC family protein [Vicinamibacterales bacterium]
MSETKEPPVYRVHLSFDQGYQFDASFPDFPGTPPLRLDEPSPLGEGRGPNAASVLAAAVGDCLSASLLFCLRKARVEVGGLQTDVSVRLGRNEAGRLRVTEIAVTLEPALAGDGASRFQRCEELFEDFCPVTQGVREGIPVTVTVKRPAGVGEQSSS